MSLQSRSPSIRSVSHRLAVPALALGALFALAPAAAAAPTQLSDDRSGSGCMNFAPVSDSTGTTTAWQSNCDPIGSNTDGSFEVFRRVDGLAAVQLTAGSGCSSGRPSISADGKRVVFESNCNPLGTNADGNFEIFAWKPGAVVQLTNSIGCDNLAPSLNGPGTVAAFESTCNELGLNNDGRGSEIYRVTLAGVLSRLTRDAVGNCSSTSASIDATGNLVAFDSDCDPLGTNPDAAIEVFTVTAAGEVRQRTSSPDDTCSSARPSMAGDGNLIAFQSDCDFTGQNPERWDRIFTVDSQLAVKQVGKPATATACVAGEPRMASSGRAVVFSSWCPLADGNADGSVEVFQSRVGAAQGSLLGVTAGSGCSSIAGTTNAEGTRVAFDSDCALTTANADRSVEVFRDAACSCGAPSSRKAVPKTTDALFVLRSAVGIVPCSPCECDVTGEGSVTAADALRVLRKAVGINVTLTCPAP